MRGGRAAHVVSSFPNRWHFGRASGFAEKKFSQFLASGLTSETVEAMYKAAHAAIRKDPKAAPKSSYKPDASFAKKAKATLAERKAAVEAKKAARIAQLRAASNGAATADDEDDE